MNKTATQWTIEVRDLAPGKPYRFDLAAQAEILEQLREALGLIALRKVSFRGAITPLGKRDWQLTADLGATVVQPCVVTLAPVTSRIEAEVNRKFLTNLPEIDESEAEMPDDDTVEALGQEIDLMAILMESLSLNLPDYPRAEGAALGDANFAEPGVTALTDEDARPFASLAGLKAKLSDQQGDK